MTSLKRIKSHVNLSLTEEFLKGDFNNIHYSTNDIETVREGFDISELIMIKTDLEPSQVCGYEFQLALAFHHSFS